MKQQESLSLAKAIVAKPGQLVIKEMNLTIQEVFDKPLIRDAFKGDNNGTVIYGVVNALVTRFLDAFAFTQKLTKPQIEILTVVALEKFEYEALEDVILFFKMCRAGSFGAAKKSIDANLLFGDWFPQYLEFKAQEREIFTNKQKTADKLEVDKVNLFYQRQKAKEAKETKLIAVKRHIDKIVDGFDRQMLEDMIFDWKKDPARKPYLDYLKRKRKEVPWIKKDNPLYEQRKQKDLEHMIKIVKSNEVK